MKWLKRVLLGFGVMEISGRRSKSRAKNVDIQKNGSDSITLFNSNSPNKVDKKDVKKINKSINKKFLI